MSRPESRSPSRRDTLRVGAATAALLSAERAPALAEDLNALRAAQGAANSKPGARSVPAKVLPVPEDLDPAVASLVAGPYSQLWNLSAVSAEGWRAIVRQGDAQLAPRLAQARTALGVKMEAATMGGVGVFVLSPKTLPEARRRRTVLHLHGGGFVFGHGEAGTQEAMLMAALGGYHVVSVDYRMPPDAPFPAGLDDATAVWRALLAQHDPKRMAVQGTSAGGNLTLALALRAKRLGLPQPGALAPGSPPVDFTFKGDSWRTNEWVDNVLVSGRSPYLTQVGRMYTAGHDLTDPEVSPLFGDFAGLPPTILTTGTRDVVLSDTVRAHRKLRRAGVEASLQVYEGLSHSQQLFDMTLTLPREIYGDVARFFDLHLMV